MFNNNLGTVARQAALRVPLSAFLLLILDKLEAKVRRSIN